MQIKPVFNDINICMAGNVNYAEPIRTMIYSLLLHADKSRKYEFIIMSSDFDEKIKAKFNRFKAENVAVTFVDMQDFHGKVSDRVKNYITAETNYRLYLFSEFFLEYDRMLYLDGDMQTVDDISKLYDTDLEGKAIGACIEAPFRALAISKRAVFFDGKPCNINTYCTEFLGLENPEEYFNAGMLLLDLKKCREITDDVKALEVLNAHKMQFNDQDTLNIIFEGKVKLLDIRWNYSVAIPNSLNHFNKSIAAAYADLKREDYGIVHYVSSKKPWNCEVTLGEIYKQNNSQMVKEEITDEG